MLKIRYNTKSRLLTGWTDNESEFDQLKARKGERATILSIVKPDVDDYEHLLYKGGALVENPNKQLAKPERDLAAEIDELKARVIKLEEVSIG